MLLGVLGHILEGHQKLGRGCRQRIRIDQDAADHLAQRLLHLLHAVQEAAGIAWRAVDLGTQIAVNDTLRDLPGDLRIAPQQLEQVARDQRQGNGDETANHRHPGEKLHGILTEQGINVVYINAGFIE